MGVGVGGGICPGLGRGVELEQHTHSRLRIRVLLSGVLGFEYQLRRLLATCPWRSHIIALSLIFMSVNRV